MYFANLKKPILSRCVIYLAFAICAPVLQANLPEPEDALRRANQQQQQLKQSLSCIEQQQHKLAQIEADSYAYDVTIIPPLLALGACHQQLRHNHEAVAAYARALHIQRIGGGLNNADQLPIVQRLIDSNSLLENWQQVDRHHELAYYLKSRLFQPQQDGFAAALTELGDWKLKAYRQNLLATSDSASLAGLNKMVRRYNHALGKISPQDSGSNASVEILHGKTLALFEIARYNINRPVESFGNPSDEVVSKRVCRSVRDGSGNVVQNCYHTQQLNPDYRRSQHRDKQIAVQTALRNIDLALQKIKQANDGVSEPIAAVNATKILELDRGYADLLNNRAVGSYY